MPNLNRELQIAVGNAGPQPGAPDCSGQNRISTGEFPSGMGSAGPHPGNAQIKEPVPDFIGQKKNQKKVSKIYQIIVYKKYI